MDSRFRVTTLAATPEPNRVIYAAMHQDYSEGFVSELPGISEHEAGVRAMGNLLASKRGHYGPLEHPQITFGVGYFPHSVMQQARTHRVGVSFDVQSFRYTGQRVIGVADGITDVEEVFYLRPVGEYRGRQGGYYDYTEIDRNSDLDMACLAASHYRRRVAAGMPYEQARSLLPFDTRQNFVVSFNVRSLMHFLDLRAKADAQPEIRQLCDLMLQEFLEWTPLLASWYQDNRWAKAQLSP